MKKLLTKKVLLALLALVSAVLGVYLKPELVTALVNVADTVLESAPVVNSADAGVAE